MLGGGVRWLSLWVSRNGTVSPAATLNAATVVSPSPRNDTGVRSTVMSGPATAMMPGSSGRRVTQGTAAP